MPSVLKVNNNEIIDSSGKVTTTAFPAGIVLQVVYDQSRESNLLNQTYTNYYEVAITLKSSSSDVFGFFTWDYQISTLNEDMV